jgi:hypothetical protein
VSLGVFTEYINMYCEILTACTDAKDADGMFTISGAFTRLTVPHTPVILEELVIALRVRFSSDEDGPHKLALSLSDLDGTVLGPPANASFVSATRASEHYTWSCAVIRVREIRIAKSDDYLLSLTIDGQSISNTTLFLIDGSKKL